MEFDVCLLKSLIVEWDSDLDATFHSGIQEDKPSMFVVVDVLLLCYVVLKICEW